MMFCLGVHAAPGITSDTPRIPIPALPRHSKRPDSARGAPQQAIGRGEPIPHRHKRRASSSARVPPEGDRVMRYGTTVRCKELADARGIRAHVIAPGATETPLAPSFWANA